MEYYACIGQCTRSQFDQGKTEAFFNSRAETPLGLAAAAFKAIGIDYERESCYVQDYINQLIDLTGENKNDATVHAFVLAHELDIYETVPCDGGRRRNHVPLTLDFDMHEFY